MGKYKEFKEIKKELPHNNMIDIKVTLTDLGEETFTILKEEK